MDANEPKVDGLDVEEMVFYENCGRGALCFFRGIKRIGLVDAYIVGNRITEWEAGKPLKTSYTVRGGREVRYDFLFVKNSFAVSACRYLYEESIEAESDHALVEAELKI